MIKIANKIFYILKNIMLPIVLVATIYIIMFMFKRLEKEIFGANLMEFIGVIAPFVVILILSVVNATLKQDNIRNNLFYNITSFIVMFTICIFCYRALFDQNMFLWHKYGYNINFNYFADQVAPIKVMLYGLSIANILLMVEWYIKDEEKVLVEEKEKKVKSKTKESN